MAAKMPSPLFSVGEMVKIRNSGFKRGKIVELWGPLAPGGMQAYRVIVRRKPKPVYIDLREDQIIPIPAGE